jgi:hypothetical protein
MKLPGKQMFVIDSELEDSSLLFKRFSDRPFAYNEKPVHVCTAEELMLWARDVWFESAVQGEATSFEEYWNQEGGDD